MIDPSCEDITGRVLEALAQPGRPARPSGDPAGRRLPPVAGRTPDGTWYGRWGCNYIYGTWLALRGLLHAGEDLSAPSATSAPREWLRATQNADGGWGELQHSYDDPSAKGVGPSTPSQTAWALWRSSPSGDDRSECVRRGVDYLLRHSSTTAPGGTSTGPAPAFRRSSTCGIICMRRTSRSGPCRSTRGRRCRRRCRREPALRRGSAARPLEGVDHDAISGSTSWRSTIQNSVRNAIRGQQALSVRADARAALHLQPGLHRLRHRAPHRQAQGPASAREVPRGGRGLRGADRLDLRRRADDLSGAAGARRPRSSSASATSTSARTACCSTRRSTASSRPTSAS